MDIPIISFLLVVLLVVLLVIAVERVAEQDRDKKEVLNPNQP